MVNGAVCNDPTPRPAIKIRYAGCEGQSETVMRKIVKPWLTLAAVLSLSAIAVEMKMPVKMADAAAELKRKCPEYAEVSAKGDQLIIKLKEDSGKGGFDGQFSIDLKRLAGRSFTLSIDVKTDKLERSDHKIPPMLGKVYFNNSGHYIHAGSSEWKTLTFKGLKVPGNGLVKLRITLKNFSGEVSFRNPVYKGDLPKSKADNKKKKKKDKK